VPLRGIQDRKQNCCRLPHGAERCQSMFEVTERVVPPAVDGVQSPGICGEGLDKRAPRFHLTSVNAEAGFEVGNIAGCSGRNPICGSADFRSRQVPSCSRAKLDHQKLQLPETSRNAATQVMRLNAITIALPPTSMRDCRMVLELGSRK
jgi:hypothetical protein